MSDDVNDDRPRCPKCDTPITSVSVRGPDDGATLAQCGHTIAANHDVLEEL